MSTHVYVLQRLKALGDEENGATLFALDPMGKCAERLLLRSAAIDYTHIYTGTHLGSQWRLMCKSDYHESA